MDAGRKRHLQNWRGPDTYQRQLVSTLRGKSGLLEGEFAGTTNLAAHWRWLWRSFGVGLRVVRRTCESGPDKLETWGRRQTRQEQGMAAIVGSDVQMPRCRLLFFHVSSRHGRPWPFASGAMRCQTPPPHMIHLSILPPQQSPWLTNGQQVHSAEYGALAASRQRGIE